MNLDEFIRTINKIFTQFPKAQLWEKYAYKRLYFNKTEGDDDFTFYI